MQEYLIAEAFDIESEHAFKGNIDIEKLEHVYRSHKKEQIAMCIVTLTCNSSGGQPVSMHNLREVFQLSKKYNIKLVKFHNFSTKSIFIII